MLRDKRSASGAMLVCVLSVASVGPASGQTELTTGAVVPVYLNGKPPNNAGPEGNYAATPGIWADVAIPLARGGSAPRTTPAPFVVLAGAEFPLSYKRHVVHPGSAGYVARLEHRDVVLSGVVAVTEFSPNTRWLLGGGVVFTRLSGDIRYTGLCCLGSGPSPLSDSEIRPAVIGGVEHHLRVGRRLALTVGCRVRVTLRSARLRDGGYGQYTVVPRVGIAVPF
jgi:hypothetical protein